MFERINSKTKFNLFQAIIKCTLDTNFVSFNNIQSCRTMQDVCSIIESNPEFHEINDKLSANIKSYFCCNFCGDTPDNLSSLDNQIFIFKQTMNKQLVGYPVVSSNMNESNTNCICNNCNNSTNNLEMDIHKQVFLKCPSCLIVSSFHCCLLYMTYIEFLYHIDHMTCFLVRSEERINLEKTF